MQNILPLPFCCCHSRTEWGWNLFTCIVIAAAAATAAQCEQVHLILWNPIVMTEKCCHSRSRSRSRSRTVWTDLYCNDKYFVTEVTEFSENNSKNSKVSYYYPSCQSLHVNVFHKTVKSWLHYCHFWIRCLYRCHYIWELGFGCTEHF